MDEHGERCHGEAIRSVAANTCCRGIVVLSLEMVGKPTEADAEAHFYDGSIVVGRPAGPEGY